MWVMKNSLPARRRGLKLEMHQRIDPVRGLAKPVAVWKSEEPPAFPDGWPAARSAANGKGARSVTALGPSSTLMSLDRVKILVAANLRRPTSSQERFAEPCGSRWNRTFLTGAA